VTVADVARERKLPRQKEARKGSKQKTTPKAFASRTKETKTCSSLKCFCYLRLLKPLIDLFERQGSFEGYTQAFPRSSILHRFEVSVSADVLQFALLHFAAVSCYRAPPRAKTCPLGQFPLLAKMCLCPSRTRRPPVRVEGYDFKNYSVYTPRLSCTSRTKREIPECLTNVLLPMTHQLNMTL
jgi:hypothetical protein